MVKKVNRSSSATAAPSRSGGSAASPEASPPTPRTRARLTQLLKAPYKLLTGIIWGNRTPSNLPFEAQVAPVLSTSAVAANAGSNTQFPSTQVSRESTAAHATDTSQDEVDAATSQHRLYTFKDYDVDYRREADEICKAVKAQGGGTLNNDGIANRAARARHRRLLEVLHNNGVDLLQGYEGRTPLQDAEFELRCLKAAQGAEEDRPVGFRAPLKDYQGNDFVKNHPDRERATAYKRRVHVLQGNIAFLKCLQRSALTDELRCTLSRCTPEDLRKLRTLLVYTPKETVAKTLAEREDAVRRLLVGQAPFGLETPDHIPSGKITEATHILVDLLNERAARRRYAGIVGQDIAGTGNMAPVQSPEQPERRVLAIPLGKEKVSARTLKEDAKTDLQNVLDEIVKDLLRTCHSRIEKLKNLALKPLEAWSRNGIVDDRMRIDLAAATRSINQFQDDYLSLEEKFCVLIEETYAESLVILNNRLSGFAEHIPADTSADNPLFQIKEKALKEARLISGTIEEARKTVSLLAASQASATTVQNSGPLETSSSHAMEAGPHQLAEAAVPLEEALKATFNALNRLIAPGNRADLSEELVNFIGVVSGSENTDFDVALRLVTLPDRSDVRKVSRSAQQLDWLLAAHILQDNPRYAAKIVEHLAKIVNLHQGELAALMETRHAFPQAENAISLQEQMERLEAPTAGKAQAHEQSKLIDTVLNLVPDTLSVDEAVAYFNVRVIPICVQSNEVVRGAAKDMLLAKFNQRFPGSLDPENDRTKLLIPLERALLGSRGKALEKPSTLFKTVMTVLKERGALNSEDVNNAPEQEEVFHSILQAFEQEIKENGFFSPTLGAAQRAALFGDFTRKEFFDSRYPQETQKNLPRISLDVYGRVTDALEAWEVLHLHQQHLPPAASAKISCFHELRHRIAAGKLMARVLVQDEMLLHLQQLSVIEEFRALAQETGKTSAAEKWRSLSQIKETAVALLNKRLTEAVSQQVELIVTDAASRTLPTEIERDYPGEQAQSTSRQSTLVRGIAELEKISGQLLAVFAR